MPVFDTTSPGQGRNGNRAWLRVTGISPLRGSLRAAPIACSCGWTGVPTLVLSSQDRSAMICFLDGWTRSPPYLPLLCRYTAQVGHRAPSSVACQFSVCTWHTSGCISASGYVLEKVHMGFFPMLQRSSPLLFIQFQPASYKNSSKTSYKIHKNSKFRQYFLEPITDYLLT